MSCAVKMWLWRCMPLLLGAESVNYFVTDRKVLYEGDPVIPGTYDNVTALQCQAYCNLNANCSSFSFCGSSCYLKKACIMDHEPLVDNASWNGECVTYWKRCSALEGYEVTERLLSEQGVEIENVMTDNLGVCATACDENPGCNSFSFYAPSRGCHLKAKCVEATDALIPVDSPAAVYRTFYRCCTCSSTTTTSTMSPWQSLPRAVAFEGAGATPGTYEGYTVSDCQILCDANPYCNSFTFCSSSCYMKEQCILGGEELVPVDGWNGCVTHYNPCPVTSTSTSTGTISTITATRTSTTLNGTSSTTLTLTETTYFGTGVVPDGSTTDGIEPPDGDYVPVNLAFQRRPLTPALTMCILGLAVR